MISAGVTGLIILFLIQGFATAHSNLTVKTKQPELSSGGVLNSNGAELIKHESLNNSIKSHSGPNKSDLSQEFLPEAEYTDNELIHRNAYVENSSQYNYSSQDEDESDPTTEEFLEFIYPKSWTWALIFFHCVVFVVGLVGNCLVCVAVYRNHTMRTVTNYFIVNLAVADFLVILFCLPPSVVWDVTSTWWFGTGMCKIVLYLQVSLLNFEVII